MRSLIVFLALRYCASAAWLGLRRVGRKNFSILARAGRALKKRGLVFGSSLTTEVNSDFVRSLAAGPIALAQYPWVTIGRSCVCSASKVGAVLMESSIRNALSIVYTISIIIIIT